MKAARLAWFEGQPDLDPERLVFIDETVGASVLLGGCLRRGSFGGFGMIHQVSC